MEWCVPRILSMRLHFQRLAVTAGASAIGRHVAMKTGELALRSNRADRVWIGPDRIPV
jgi:hypothetical protein